MIHLQSKYINLCKDNQKPNKKRIFANQKKIQTDMEIKSAEFVISNSSVGKCPSTHAPEYAFIGRSNVGKSSLINMLANNKKLAKTSSTPGKTLLINQFFNQQRMVSGRPSRIRLCQNKQKRTRKVAANHLFLYTAQRTR